MVDLDRSLAAVRAISAIPALLKLLSTASGLRFVAVARVGETRWTALAVHDRLNLGMKEGDGVPVEQTLCYHSRQECRVLSVDRTSAVPELAGKLYPHVGPLESHVSAPIVLGDGTYFGNLCAMDSLPAKVENEQTIELFSGYAEVVARLLDAELAHGAALLSVEQAASVAKSREEFMAVVAHDLRNPLASFAAAAELLRRSGEARFIKTGERLRSSARRMSALIDDLVDFTRGRSGTGITIDISSQTGLNASLALVVDEIRDGYPDREVQDNLDFPVEVDCDAARIQQLASNLLGNAMVYGNPDTPVVLDGFVEGDEAVLAVSNHGPEIPAEELTLMFDPFWRASGPESGTNMGLGLHICQQIARAHKGRFYVSSSQEGGTRFELRWPGRRSSTTPTDRDHEAENQA